ncbi:hypothetical protein EPN90_03490 [Patescibacteria group bacterium]|nr:MAG: hypothetical protein EPN90_03490 [Patescibacteria group bacterium]
MEDYQLEKQMAVAIYSFLFAEAQARLRRLQEIVNDWGMNQPPLEKNGVERVPAASRVPREIWVEIKLLEQEWQELAAAARALTEQDSREYYRVADALAKLRASLEVSDTLVWAIRSAIANRGVIASRLAFWERELRRAQTP